MRRSLVLFVLACLVVWLMPLGAFIKPSQEKTACGGGRAFHMCSMMSGKAHTDNGSSKILLTDGGNVEKTAKSSTSGGDDLVLTMRRQTIAEPVSFRSDMLEIPALRFIPAALFRPPIA